MDKSDLIQAVFIRSWIPSEWQKKTNINAQLQKYYIVGPLHTVHIKFNIEKNYCGLLLHSIIIYTMHIILNKLYRKCMSTLLAYLEW